MKNVGLSAFGTPMIVDEERSFIGGEFRWEGVFNGVADFCGQGVDGVVFTRWFRESAIVMGFEA